MDKKSWECVLLLIPTVILVAFVSFFGGIITERINWYVTERRLLSRMAEAGNSCFFYEAPKLDIAESVASFITFELRGWDVAYADDVRVVCPPGYPISTRQYIEDRGEDWFDR